MRWVNVILVLAALFAIACDSPNECRYKAKKMGVDDGLCTTFDNREHISRKFRDFSKQKIETPPQPVATDSVDLKEYDSLIDKVKKITEELLDCRERLAGTTGMGCDIPANMPPRPECDCETWRK